MGPPCTYADIGGLPAGVHGMMAIRGGVDIQWGYGNGHIYAILRGSVDIPTMRVEYVLHQRIAREFICKKSS
jgi:hypothetical protein